MFDRGWVGALEWAVAGRPIDGEARSGDHWVIAEADGNALIGVVDGLGHGEAAADAAHRATDIVAKNPGEPLQTLFVQCHEALALTRGCAMTLTRIGLDDGSLGWLGVGNVTASLIRTGVDGSVTRQSALLRGGVVGYQLPPHLHVRYTEMLPGDLLLMGTDGLDSSFAEAPKPGQQTGELVGYILEQCAKGTDDALILALRNRGPSS